MKLLQTIIFIFFSLLVKGQDITYTLTHAGSRKWIGVEKTTTLSGLSSSNLIFTANHKFEEQPVNSYKNPVSLQWQVLSGNTIHDDNISLLIGDITYSIIFSKTSNGSDFITLTYYKNDKAVTKSYYSE